MAPPTRVGRLQGFRWRIAARMAERQSGLQSTFLRTSCGAGLKTGCLRAACSHRILSPLFGSSAQHAQSDSINTPDLAGTEHVKLTLCQSNIAFAQATHVTSWIHTRSIASLLQIAEG